jgi:hypothetical protein
MEREWQSEFWVSTLIAVGTELRGLTPLPPKRRHDPTRGKPIKPHALWLTNSSPLPSSISSTPVRVRWPSDLRLYLLRWLPSFRCGAFQPPTALPWSRLMVNLIIRVIVLISPASTVTEIFDTPAGAANSCAQRATSNGATNFLLSQVFNGVFTFYRCQVGYTLPFGFVPDEVCTESNYAFYTSP